MIRFVKESSYNEGRCSVNDGTNNRIHWTMLARWRFFAFFVIYCTVHQEALCGKTLNIKTEVEVVRRMNSCIRLRVLQYRLFKILFENASVAFADMLLLICSQAFCRNNYIYRKSWGILRGVVWCSMDLGLGISCGHFERNKHFKWWISTL